MAKDMFPDTEPLLVRDEPWMRVKIGPQAEPIAEPTSPSADSTDWYRVAAENWDLLQEVEGKNRRLTKECSRHEADAERLAGMNRELKEELILRNQDITDLQLTNRNLSRKIVYEMNRSNGKGSYPEGVHGS